MTAEEVGQAASLLGTGSWKREQLILSLLRQRSWTSSQKALVEKMCREEQARRQARACAQDAPREGDGCWKR